MEIKKTPKVVEFQLKDLLSIGLVFVVTGITLAFGLDITSDVQADMTVNSAEYNATANTILGVSNLTAKLPTLATVVIAAVIIGVLVSAFAFR